jgi:hypothetical protein
VPENGRFGKNGETKSLVPFAASSQFLWLHLEHSFYGLVGLDLMALVN